MNTQSATCAICGQTKPLHELIPFDIIRHTLAAAIHDKHPHCSAGSYICHDDLNRLRGAYVEDVLETEKGELTDLEREVARSMQEQDVLARNLNTQYAEHLSFGDRISDKVAEFGGSWAFIISCVVVLVGWVVTNAFLLTHPFDPLPFMGLNLVLSCIAALQAPVIMMSQNRQEAKDRLRAENDYRTNLKAELEIRHLHEKMDYLLLHQWHRLLEIQQLQMELMGEIAGRTAATPGDKAADQLTSAAVDPPRQP